MSDESSDGRARFPRGLTENTRRQKPRPSNEMRNSEFLLKKGRASYAADAAAETGSDVRPKGDQADDNYWISFFGYCAPLLLVTAKFNSS